jgi:VanZ family protein
MLYAGLGWFTGRALRTRRALSLVMALVAIAAFAAFDEWHQALVHRTPDIVDWVADMIGASFGLLVASRVTSVETVS